MTLLSTDSSEKQFSAFWPLLVILLTVLSLQVEGLSGTYKQRIQIRANIDQLSQKDGEVKKIDLVLSAVSSDLSKLAETNPNARQIVEEFQIHQQTGSTK